MQFIRCSPRKLAWALMLICISGIFHILYMNHAVGVQTKFRSWLTNQLYNRHYYVMFWNEIEELKNLQCSDPDYNCDFEIRRKVPPNYTVFDAIIFNEDILNSTDRPKERLDSQIFIFWSLIPSGKGPACKTYNDNFFNWTFTYRLNSTLAWHQFLFQRIDTKAPISAPPVLSTHNWEMNYDSVKPRVERIINNKTIALAWIIMNCGSEHQDDSYMTELLAHMNSFGLRVDVFSNCTQTSYRLIPESSNLNEVIKKYHFLIVSENYTAIDYVSDKILLAFENYAVPVVNGESDYSRFLPPGSYLSTKEMNPFSLATIIKQANDDPAFYEGFFSWSNVYKITAYPYGDNPLCTLCKALNEKNKTRNTIANFRGWWNSPEAMKSCYNNKTETN